MSGGSGMIESGVGGVRGEWGESGRGVGGECRVGVVRGECERDGKCIAAV